tara:strand:- start:5190 stop:5774 length:585 start_codon:yes stop_codon:yes gene_type:complete
LNTTNKRQESKQIIDGSNSYDEKIKLIRPYMLIFCKSRIFNFQDAEDLCQDIISILCKSESKYDKSKSFWGWAHRIAHFQIKGYLTKSKRNREHAVSEESLTESISEDSLLFSFMKTEQKMPFSNLLKRELEKERDQLMREAFEKLPLRQQHFLSLSMQGKSKNFIMRQMNITSINYHALKRRVLKTLKKQINI